MKDGGRHRVREPGFGTATATVLIRAELDREITGPRATTREGHEGMNKIIKEKLIGRAVDEFRGLLTQGIDEIVGDMENTIRARELASESALSGYQYKVAAALTINPQSDSADIKVTLSWGEKRKLVGDTKHVDDQPDLGLEPAENTEPETATAEA